MRFQELLMRWISRFSRLCNAIVVSVFLITPAIADTESDARAAEQAGRHREALALYVKALQDKGGADAALRERILAVAARVSPAPAIPEEARRFHVRAETAIKLAKSPEEFKEAVTEFQRAVSLAPWWADAYFNLGVAYEGAGDFAAAIGAMKLYLSARPNAADSAQVRDRLYALEFKQERASRAGQVRPKATAPSIGELVRQLDGAVYRVSGERAADTWFEVRIRGGSILGGVYRTTALSVIPAGYQETFRRPLDAFRMPFSVTLCGDNNSHPRDAVLSPDGRTLTLLTPCRPGDPFTPRDLIMIRQ